MKCRNKTSEWYKAECLRMWTLMRDKNIGKYMALKRMGYKDHELPTSECFACEYVLSQCCDPEHTTDPCNENGAPKCPIPWPSKTGHCCDPGSTYLKWCVAKSYAEELPAINEIIELIQKWEER